LQRDQAEKLVIVLEAAFDRQLRSDTREVYVTKLMQLPYATGMRRVDTAINTCKFMPKIAELMCPTEGEVQQTNMPVEDTWSSTPAGQFAAYRAERLAELDEEEYWAYTIDPAERARLENIWSYAGSKQRPSKVG
jgi:hypothetical protein